MSEPKKRILIVDDEEEICDFLQEKLSQGPFEATAVFTGEQALKSFEEKPFDLLIVDLKLSTRVTGLDVIKKCRQSYPQTKIIAMTGYVDMKLQEEAERAGVSDYAEKPTDIQPEVIYRKVSKLLGISGA